MDGRPPHRRATWTRLLTHPVPAQTHRRGCRRRTLMIAAIYARKSTDQSTVADEAKSVTRQVDHARAYAAKHGWTVDDRCIFVDDGISGAEFENRPGFL